MQSFQLQSKFQPAGDQPKAIRQLLHGIQQQQRNQVLLGVTGSGKTFTMANVIAKSQKPALIIAHNKTLAAQLHAEMRSFFPKNAVEYFVSYYDYYQPEAYIPRTDLYIEKDATINEQLDLLRHSATRSLLERRDVIVISSVSCIYGLGAPELYLNMTMQLELGMTISRNEVIAHLVELQYKRNDVNFERGTFRVRGDTVDIFPSHYKDRGWKINFLGNEIDKISEFDALLGNKTKILNKITIFANSHYVTPRLTLEQAIKQIKIELREQLIKLRSSNKLVEAQRLEQRVNFDLEMIVQTCSCKGIENYSRYLSGKNPGEPPPTLFEYLPKDTILFVDESHVTIPQIRGMFNGDRARKSILVEYGFRLPSALDNRPLTYTEWDAMRPNTIFVSATPGQIEMELSKGYYIEQIIRPTGLLDPICIVRPAASQVDDLLDECREVVALQQKILVTTLTKKMAEDLTSYLNDIGIKSIYLHSEVHTLERVEIITKLRQGTYDVLVGVNLLREGLDIPECALVAILDADKEGFLRSETSLIQTIGRAARNKHGRAILYADKITCSIANAVEKTKSRRQIQLEFNQKHGITPRSITKNIHNALEEALAIIKDEVEHPSIQEIDVAYLQAHIPELKRKMREAAEGLAFEQAAKLRDKIALLEKQLPVVS